jgi:hypothetical protein
MNDEEVVNPDEVKDEVDPRAENIEVTNHPIIEPEDPDIIKDEEPGE